jgi:ribosome-associated protein
MRLKKLQKAIVTALEDIKARAIEVIDVTKLTAMFDYVIIASADSGRQARALAMHVHDVVKQAGGKIYGMEGEQTDWMLVDCGDTVVHIMLPAAREHYNLEQLWQPKRAPNKEDAAPGREPTAKPRTRSSASTRKSSAAGIGSKAKTAKSAAPGRKPARKPAASKRSKSTTE